MLETLNSIINVIDGYVWGLPLMILLVGTGLFLTLKSRFIQFRAFGHGWALLSGKYDKDEGTPGEITHFQSLSTALSATIGTGNIAGVATAIASGGPGAVFWMWITALAGMATKYHCCLLAQKLRKIEENGTVSGGPAYFLSEGLKHTVYERTVGKILPAKTLGLLFAVFTVIASFGIGNMTQANSIADPLFKYFGISKLLTGIIIAVLIGFVIIGGVKRIASVSSMIVPFMVAAYAIASLIIIIKNYDMIIPAFQQIFYYAFHDHQAIAGGFLGAAMRYGVARGLFSNEAGLGSAAMAHAAAKTKEPVREGLVAMLGPFIDTIIVCTMTALVIVIAGQEYWGSGISGANLSTSCYDSLLSGAGRYIVAFGLVFFAFTTILGWSYYGDRNVEYLFGEKGVKIYHLIFILIIPVGSVLQLDIVWNFSDITNGLMAIPNLIGLLFLSGFVAKMTKDYFARNKGQIPPKDQM